MNYKGTLQDCPCRDCVTDRDSECHCRCEKYRDWKQARAEMAENANKIKDVEQSLTEYDINKSKRIYKKGRTK